MWIDQGLHQVELREFKQENYNKIHDYLKCNFPSAYWDAFNHRFRVPDKDHGRHDGMKILSKLKDL